MRYTEKKCCFSCHKVYKVNSHFAVTLVRQERPACKSHKPTDDWTRLAEAEVIRATTAHLPGCDTLLKIVCPPYIYIYIYDTPLETNGIWWQGSYEDHNLGARRTAAAGENRREVKWRNSNIQMAAAKNSVQTFDQTRGDCWKTNKDGFAHLNEVCFTVINKAIDKNLNSVVVWL